MLFKDILEKKTKEIEPEFDSLFEQIKMNQKHKGDMLLVLVNGFFDLELTQLVGNSVKLSPYVIGPNKEGHSETLHYEFIHQYRTTHLSQISHLEYLKEFEWTPERRGKIEKLQKIEGTTIQLEMLIYLKIWEADSFIKRFYQFARLINSESYDWHFKIAESNRDSNSTGNRQEIIRKKTRDKIKTKLPRIYSAFKCAYKTQIRNSIAHSNFSFLSRHIHLNNHIKGDDSSSEISISFDDWIDIFHETMVVYNQYIRLKNKINDFYSQEAEKSDSQYEILVTKVDTKITQEERVLEFRPEWKDWVWYKKE